MEFGIDRYTGNWKSEDGLFLRIVKLDETRAEVTLLETNGKPVVRPYWNNRPTIDMPADYDDYMGEFTVHLWEPSRFSLHLHYRVSDRWMDLNQELLVPSISQYEEDRFLEQYHRLFGNLADFKRAERQNKLPERFSKDRGPVSEDTQRS
jgi:hypothetical protein